MTTHRLRSTVVFALCLVVASRVIAQSAAAPTAGTPASFDPTASTGFGPATLPMRKARCATAICFGESYKFALEPLIELPIGKSFTSNGLGALANFENSHDVSATFTAGARFWVFYDLISFSLYLSKPVFSQAGTLRVAGSAFEYSADNVRRPYPGFAIGLLADVVWIGFDIDELRNGDTDATHDPRFPRNAVVSRAPVFTIALAPVTLARNALGNASSSK
jgi:hypothetical protein